MERVLFFKNRLSIHSWIIQGDDKLLNCTEKAPEYGLNNNKRVFFADRLVIVI